MLLKWNNFLANISITFSMASEIFYGHSEDSHQMLAPQPQTGGANQLVKNQRALCWMLFLVAKAKVLWHRQELLATFHLLLCCIGEVVRITPSFLLLPPFGMCLNIFLFFLVKIAKILIYSKTLWIKKPLWKSLTLKAIQMNFSFSLLSVPLIILNFCVCNIIAEMELEQAIHISELPLV